MKKPGLVQVVPIISVIPPRLARWLDSHSAENSRASIPHHAEQAIARRAKRNDSDSNRSAQEPRGIIIKRETPPFRRVEVLLRKQSEPPRCGEHDGDRDKPASCVLLGRW